ncbi:hypothetical protein BJ742DRAFT_787962 [Cladochytrium replicatum]|nr:hypothetical protein BJ742DRAFT_787962 [Cladochytrium replicatum]
MGSGLEEFRYNEEERSGTRKQEAAIDRKRKREENDLKAKKGRFTSNDESSEDEHVLSSDSVERRPTASRAKAKGDSKRKSSVSSSGCISEHSLQFFSELEENNNKDFFHQNKYRSDFAREEFVRFVEEVMDRVRAHDETIREENGRLLINRVNRAGARFGGPPYQAWLSFTMSKTGKKGASAKYYLHVQPNNRSFVAAGIWQPPTDIITPLRQNIANDSRALRRVLALKSFVDVFHDSLFTNDHAQPLKSAPRGYSKDHPDLDLLRLKSFVCVHNFQDEEVMAPNKAFLENVVSCFVASVPFVREMNALLG